MIKSFYNLFTIVLFLLTSSFSYGQELNYCGTTHVDETWLRYFNSTNAPFSKARDCGIYVPLTVHVVGKDNGIGYHPYISIFNSLLTLNKDYEDAGITFYLAGPLNYINNTAWYDHSSFNVGSQMMNQNNIPNTINCYIVDNAAENCGYRAYDGNAVALAKSCTSANDHTWAHEIGHWLGLPHTFRGWENTNYNTLSETPLKLGGIQVELVDGSNCASAGDLFCDTSPDYLSYRWICNEEAKSPDILKDPNGDDFQADGSYIMGYARDDCQSKFSNDQNLSMCTYLKEKIPSYVTYINPIGNVNPNQTILTYPIGGAFVENNVKLKWREDGNATFYIVEYSKISSLGLSSKELVYGNELELFGLDDDKNYYWRVIAMNEYDFNYQNKTEIEKFNTGGLSSTQDYYEKHLKIYPNPVTSQKNFTLSLDSQNTDEINLKIYNAQGQLAYSNAFYIKNGENELQIEIPELAKGIYFISGVGKSHKFQEKIVIE